MTSTSLISQLQTIRRRMLTIGVSAGVGWAILIWMGVLAIFMWIDLVLELPPQLRLTSGRIAILFAIGWVLFVAWSAVRRAKPGMLARKLDQIAGTGGEILSGIDLMLDPRPKGALTGGLASLAVDRAASLAAEVPVTTAVPARPMGWAFGSLAASVMGIGMIGIFLPGLIGTQWARFADPFNDHPPYTRIVFDTNPGDTKVLYGDPLDIHVSTTGPTVDRMELVLRAAGASTDEVLPMFPKPEGGWRTSIAHVTEPAQYFVRAHRARSQHYNIEVVTIPRLEGARFRVTPPTYTNLKPYDGPLPQGGLAGLPGTRVEVWLKSNRPLSGGAMELETQQGTEQLPMQAAGPKSTEATGSFEIRQAGKVTMKVIDEEGQASREAFSTPVILLADQRPFVRLLEPQEMSLATPDAPLPVSIMGEDDYGLTRVRLFRSLNDSRALPQDIELSPPPPTRREETLILPLAQFKLEPGDEIKLYARVEDNDPAGAKGAESTVATVHIIAQEDYEKMMLMREGMEVLQSKYQQAERRMETIKEQLDKLQKELEQLPPDSELSEQKQRDIEQLARQMDQDAQEMREAADHELPYDLDKALTPELDKLAKTLEDAARQLEQLMKNEQGEKKPGIPKAGGMSDKLKEMAKAMAGEKQEYEEDVTAPLEHLAKIFPLLEDEARFLSLYARQRDLEQRLASLKGRDNEDDPQLKARMRDLEAEQRGLREDLKQLLDDIESHSAQLPEDDRLKDLRETAGKFVTALRGSGAAEAMSEGEEGLAAFSGTRGHAGAKEGADILEQFIGQCNGMGDGAGTCLKFSPSLSKGLGNTIEQMLANAGMKPGNVGLGPAGKGGYSASRSTMENMGLYGTLPLVSQQTGAGGRESRIGARGRQIAGTDGDNNPWAIDPSGKFQASGAASGAVPVLYRSRVGAYFQRMADEAK
jgi:hypothetical protein